MRVLLAAARGGGQGHRSVGVEDDGGYEDDHRLKGGLGCTPRGGRRHEVRAADAGTGAGWRAQGSSPAVLPARPCCQPPCPAPSCVPLGAKQSLRPECVHPPGGPVCSAARGLTKPCQAPLLLKLLQRLPLQPRQTLPLQPLPPAVLVCCQAGNGHQHGRAHHRHCKAKAATVGREGCWKGSDLQLMGAQNACMVPPSWPMASFSGLGMSMQHTRQVRYMPALTCDVGRGGQARG